MGLRAVTGLSASSTQPRSSLTGTRCPRCSRLLAWPRRHAHRGQPPQQARVRRAPLGTRTTGLSSPRCMCARAEASRAWVCSVAAAKASLAMRCSPNCSAFSKCSSSSSSSRRSRGCSVQYLPRPRLHDRCAGLLSLRTRGSHCCTVCGASLRRLSTSDQRVLCSALQWRVDGPRRPQIPAPLPLRLLLLLLPLRPC
jgi:hypothetical protein